MEEMKLPLDKVQNERLLNPTVSHYIKKLIEIDQAPNILMSATEFGTLTIKDQPITAKVGGLAVVINDMIKNSPSFLEKRKGTISFAFMSYDGVPETPYIRSFSIDMAGHNQQVNLHKHVDESGANIFFLDHPLFKRRAINDPQNNLYVDRGGDLYSGRWEWEDCYTYSLFCKSVAKLREMLEANIYHAHDYHTALAALHMPQDTIVSMTIHNAGPGYQGIYYTTDYGNERIPHPNYPQGVPIGDTGANDHLLGIIGVDFDTYMRYFEDKGTFNSLRILKYIEDRNMIAGSPVSDGYALELDNDLHCMLDGIENGLSDRNKARNHPFLKRKSEVELANIHPFISNRHHRALWRYGLNFGFDLKSEKGKDQVQKRKALLKRILQTNAGIEINPNKPLFVLVSRIVSQKNVAVLAENINHIISIGGQVIIAGQPGDSEGHCVAGRIHYLENLPQNRGQVKFFNEFANKEMSTLIQAGGDFFVITSRFEPCGLTDIEAAWLGTIPITRKTGGLGKVKNSFTYEWNDTNDATGEIKALRDKLSEASAFYYLYRSDFHKMRIGAMSEDFSWEIALERYFENYRVSAFYKLACEISWQYHSPEVVAQLMSLIAQNLPNKLIGNYLRILDKKAYLNRVEEIFKRSYLLPSLIVAQAN